MICTINCVQYCDSGLMIGDQHWLSVRIDYTYGHTYYPSCGPVGRFDTYDTKQHAKCPNQFAYSKD